MLLLVLRANVNDGATTWHYYQFDSKVCFGLFDQWIKYSLTIVAQYTTNGNA
jgi:hypothetical protein